MSEDLVPCQTEGKSLELSEEIVALDVEDAHRLFGVARKRLLQPACWHALAGTLSASFNIDGKSGDDNVEVGDHLRISIPAPGLAAGDGDDWVCVAAIEQDFDNDADASFGIRVSVCANPHKADTAIAHFFAEGASSSFLLTRKDKIITASYIGRNEKPNTNDLSLTDKMRNLIVAGGALSGISELHWRALLKGLLADN